MDAVFMIDSKKLDSQFFFDLRLNGWIRTQPLETLSCLILNNESVNSSLVPSDGILLEVRSLTGFYACFRVRINSLFIENVQYWESAIEGCGAQQFNVFLHILDLLEMSMFGHNWIQTIRFGGFWFVLV